MISPIYNEAKRKPRAIIFDIDGVICNSSKRFLRFDFDALKRGDTKAMAKSIKEYNKDTIGDKPIEAGINLLNSLMETQNIEKVFLITARGDGGYQPTLDWLNENIKYKDRFELIMKKETGNLTFSTPFESAKYKQDYAKKLMKKYDILYAVDDSSDNISAFKELGLVTLQFNDPNTGKVLV